MLLASTKAGTAEHEAVETVRQALADAGEVELRTTQEPAELERALDALDGRTLVVAGGDGSLHLAVARLYSRGELKATTIALVPLGTGNDFARTAGVPLEPAAAAELVVTGTARPVDLLVDDAGEVVVNAAHVGVGAEAAGYAAGLKSRLGPLAYPLGAVRAGLSAPGWRVRVELDGRVVADADQRSLMIGIGNGRTIGGGTALLPDAEPDDGRLDVVVSQATGPLARVRYGCTLLAGHHLSGPAVRAGRGTSVTISGEPMPLNVDGELGEPVARRTWTIEPAAWSLVRP